MSARADFVTSDTCRLCGARGLTSVLDYGEMPLANALPRSPEAAMSEKVYPLTLAFCHECSLIQIRETVSPEVLFSDYPYFSSNSPMFVEMARNLAERLIESQHLDRMSLVAEAASNDGYLLKHYAARDIPVVGIEPAANVAAEAAAHGVRTRVEFFGQDGARRIVEELGKADVFHANNVLAHVPQLGDFVAGIAELMSPNGIASIEVPYAGAFIEHCEFDTVYHEHLCYFSLSALTRLFAKNNLEIVDIEHLPIHGGSLRVFVMHAGSRAPSGKVNELLVSEQQSGLDSIQRLVGFAASAKSVAKDLKDLVSRLRADGKSVAAYGASAKGATLLNFTGIGHELLDFVADRSPIKRGRFMPGVHLPIVEAEALAVRRPDYALLLTWNFAEEIFAQQTAYTRAGGSFIVPIPTPQIIDAA